MEEVGWSERRIADRREIIGGRRIESGFGGKDEVSIMKEKFRLSWCAREPSRCMACTQGSEALDLVGGGWW